MKILFVASEVYPLIKSGGLADVISALPKALRNKDLDVRIAMPNYPGIDSKHLKYTYQPQVLKLHVPSGAIDCLVSEVVLPDTDIPVYLFKTGRGLTSASLYPSPEEGDQDRFLIFSRAVTEWLKVSAWQPDVVHCHDWMTGAIPQLIKQNKLPYPTLLTIHNLFYQGVIPAVYFDDLGINVSTTSPLVNLLRMGILGASKVNTVSATYAKEALTVEYGCGLEQALRKRGSDFIGILNGVDYEVYNPTQNPQISHPYNAENVTEGKQENKRYLQSTLKLEEDNSVPLYGFVARLDNQKGLDLIEASIKSTPLLAHSQLVILGVGEKYWQRRLAALTQQYPERLVVVNRFDEKLAHQIYAASDFFLVPSKYEPCGLTQLIAMKYGSIPIVRNTGGLADTVIDQKQHPARGTGIVFDNYAAKDFSQALGMSLGLFNQPSELSQVVQRAMRQDFSWQKASDQYAGLYRQLMNK